MSRLTERDNLGCVIHGDAIYSDWDVPEGFRGEAIEYLAALEDILYAPDGTELITLDRLRELVEADRDGRCVVLPCKAGDTVYKLWYEPCRHGNTYPDGMDCCGCEDECDIERAVIQFTANSVEHIVGMMGSLGSLWFLTRAEAEEALQKEAQHE